MLQQKNQKKETEADDRFSSMMSKCNSSWIVGMDLGSKDNK